VPTLLAEQVAEALPRVAVAVYLDEGRGLRLAGTAGFELPVDAIPQLVARAVDERRFVTGGRSECAELRECGLAARRAAAAPLLVDRTAVGALLVVAEDLFTTMPQPAQLASFAHVAGMLLCLEQRAEAGEAAARRDPLTGLANRRAFDEALENRLGSRALQPFALALLDLDEFKQINDRDGHGAGDALLRVVAETMLAKTRAGEELFRIGGDEFALVVRGHAADAQAAVARLQESVASIVAPSRPITLSAGIAVSPADGASRERLVEKADRALYAAKASRHAVRGGITAASDEAPAPRLRVLVVDDDAGLRELLRTTFELMQILVSEAADAAEARRRLAEARPDVIVLDVGLPDVDGLTLCRSLKDDAATAAIPVVLLSGLEEAERHARDAGAAAFVKKPFSPLELSSTILALTHPSMRIPTPAAAAVPGTQLIAYAADVGRLLEIGLRQQSLLQTAYRQTVAVLAAALDSKDQATGSHSQRVVGYASELTLAIAPPLLDDPTLEYGFLLHDIGKIGVPDTILQKRGPLTEHERELIEQHPILGADLLREVTLVDGEGINVVRSHHERWDGRGYPDGLALREIPLGARIFAVADTLDALTSERPYRRAQTWADAGAEIRRESGRQFDPVVVEAFSDLQPQLQSIYERTAA
jgi:ribonuclease P protein subunit RPR2